VEVQIRQQDSPSDRNCGCNPCATMPI